MASHRLTKFQSALKSVSSAPRGAALQQLGRQFSSLAVTHEIGGSGSGSSFVEFQQQIQTDLKTAFQESRVTDLRFVCSVIESISPLAPYMDALSRATFNEMNERYQHDWASQVTSMTTTESAACFKALLRLHHKRTSPILHRLISKVNIAHLRPTDLFHCLSLLATESREEQPYLKQFVTEGAEIVLGLCGKPQSCPSIIQILATREAMQAYGVNTTAFDSKIVDLLAKEATYKRLWEDDEQLPALMKYATSYAPRMMLREDFKLLVTKKGIRLPIVCSIFANSFCESQQLSSAMIMPLLWQRVHGSRTKLTEKDVEHVEQGLARLQAYIEKNGVKNCDMSLANLPATALWNLWTNFRFHMERMPTQALVNVLSVYFAEHRSFQAHRQHASKDAEDEEFSSRHQGEDKERGRGAKTRDPDVALFGEGSPVINELMFIIKNRAVELSLAQMETLFQAMGYLLPAASSKVDLPDSHPTSVIRHLLKDLFAAKTTSGVFDHLGLSSAINLFCFIAEAGEVKAGPHVSYGPLKPVLESLRETIKARIKAAEGVIPLADKAIVRLARSLPALRDDADVMSAYLRTFHQINAVERLDLNSLIELLGHLFKDELSRTGGGGVSLGLREDLRYLKAHVLEEIFHRCSTLDARKAKLTPASIVQLLETCAGVLEGDASPTEVKEVTNLILKCIRSALPELSSFKPDELVAFTSAIATRPRILFDSPDVNVPYSPLGLLPETLISSFKAQASSLTFDQLVSSFTSFAKLELYDEALVYKMLLAANKIPLHVYTLESLVALSTAFVKLRVYHGPLMVRLSAWYVQACQAMMSGSELPPAHLEHLTVFSMRLAELGFNSEEVAKLCDSALSQKIPLIQRIRPSTTDIKQTIHLLNSLAKFAYFTPRFMGALENLLKAFMRDEALLTSLSRQEQLMLTEINLCSYSEMPYFRKMIESDEYKSFFQRTTNVIWFHEQQQKRDQFLTSDDYTTLKRAVDTLGWSMRPDIIEYFCEFVTPDQKQNNNGQRVAMVCVKPKDELRWMVPVTDPSRAPRDGEDLENVTPNRCRTTPFMFGEANQKIRRLEEFGLKVVPILLSKWRNLKSPEERTAYLEAAARQTLPAPPPRVIRGDQD